MNKNIYIGTSGWHYNHWLGKFYPANVTGYNELKFHSTHFNTVENNSSFYRIAQESTYKTWSRMTPDHYKFSIKLNKSITHFARLELTDEVKEKISYIITSTQILKDKLGAIVIQLPPSFKYDLALLEQFLGYFIEKVRSEPCNFDVAIEFRNKNWFKNEVYDLLKQYNVALVAGQSSRYPVERHITANFSYIRMHGPDKLFASSYTREQLEDWAKYIINTPPSVKRIYVYFNNDFNAYAIDNARLLKELLNDSGLQV